MLVEAVFAPTASYGFGRLVRGGLGQISGRIPGGAAAGLIVVR